MDTSGANEESPGWAARKVLRAARAGTLATAIDGQPFASLVTPATAPDGSVLLLLSELSEHTRHLRIDGRCAVMVAGEAETANPQTAPRLTLTGVAALEPDPVLKARWVALHPYAGFYADFGDFHLWRVRPMGALFVGGFARAHRLRAAELVAGEGVVEAEASIMAHCNTDHADALNVIAAHAGLGGGLWSMVACDVDGFDLVQDETVRRIPFAAPVDGPGGVRSALVDLARAARK